MTIAFVTTANPSDVGAWSGIPFFMRRSLATHAKLIDIGPLREKFELLMKVKQVAYSRVLKKNFLRHRSPHILKGYARQIERAVRLHRPDLILSPGTLPIAYLDTDIPIVFWTDATFASMLDFYPDFSDLAKETLEQGHSAEQAALDRCALAIYSSSWAAASACADYGADPAKVRTIPFGANLAHEPTGEDVAAAISKRSSDVCRLLFIGVDWRRKGGDIAQAVAAELNGLGMRTELSVVGCAPDGPTPDYVRPLGFISKTSETGMRTLADLISQSHFLIVPSRADCTPVVFNEAGAYGVPSISTNVGGIGSVIINDVNGYIFASDAPARQYTQYIFEQMASIDRYRAFAHSTHRDYRKRLNWRVTGRAAFDMMDNLLISRGLPLERC